MCIDEGRKIKRHMSTINKHNVISYVGLFMKL
jgi:hypothetical protein